MSEMPTKLTVDFRAGTFLVEGREEFVREMWGTLESLLREQPTQTKHPAGTMSRSPGNSAIVEKARVRGTRTQQKGLSRMKDLDLMASDGVQGLYEFYNQARPKTFYETNAVFVYYLYKVRGLSVTIDHVYTCYEELGVKAPTAFQQSLRDTANSRKWIDVSDLDDVRTSIAGDNFVRTLLARESGDGD